MEPLKPVAFTPLPLGAVRPLGWLERQLRIQAEGLSGHLDEVWPDVKDSRWFGGGAEGWERAPYWLDGFIALAFVLDDPVLKERAAKYIEYILDHQEEDGWLGPRAMVEASGRPENYNYDLWGQLLALKVLAEYHEATGNKRVLAAIERNLRCIERVIERKPLFNWGQFRWFEGLVALYRLYELYPAPWLWDLAVKLQAQGFHWGEFFQRWPLTGPTSKGRWTFMGHVVNNAMAVKAHALWWRLSGAEADRKTVYDMIEKLDRYHGMATGMFTGDECLAGRSPTQGTELCAVVEYAYSLETLLSILGDPIFGDRLEKVVFNALPATFSPDMWAHQYDQQLNQVECSIQEGRTWNTNGPEANLFGLEPNYGCCTANLSQGWPKFAAHLWMRAPDGGLAALTYAPSQVRFIQQGNAVSVRLETGYPFRSELDFTVSAAKAVQFPLYLRIPAWAEEATLVVAGQRYPALLPGSIFKLDREWSGETRLLLTLPMNAELARGHHKSAAVVRGPLVYALKIGEDWRQVNTDKPGHELPHGDWEVYATTPWNYGLKVKEKTLNRDVVFENRPLGENPFSPEGAPVIAHVQGRRLPGWSLEHGSAAENPPSPVESEEPLEDLILIPYGCTNLRVTEFPALK